jgi:hypothetical protein
MRGHAHLRSHRRVVRRRGSRAIWGADARVVLRSAPGEADARVPDGITLHLVDRHLGGVAVDELNEAATLAGGDLDIGDLSEALEERAKLVLGDVAGQASNEDGGVVGVGELVHGLHGIERGGLLVVELLHGPATHGARGSSNGRSNLSSSMTTVTVLVGSSLRRSRGDTHGAVAAVDALHLNEGALLIRLLAEANKAVATGLAGHRVRHDLSRLAGGEAGLEQRHEDELVDLRAKVANEDAELGATVVAAGVGQRERRSEDSEETYRRSTNPPPEAQLSLKTREELGTGVPVNWRAFWAASGVLNSTKQ